LRPPINPNVISASGLRFCPPPLPALRPDCGWLLLLPAAGAPYVDDGEREALPAAPPPYELVLLPPGEDDP
jgi:hypothetical protein